MTIIATNCQATTTALVFYFTEEADKRKSRGMFMKCTLGYVRAPLCANLFTKRALRIECHCIRQKLY